tara:strand:+ start:1647 stop:2009 length:363 start_codon:yes stop_codon:yes gene_type:complete
MADMQKMTKEEALTKVAQGVGSIYSKEDVVNLINSIEENAGKATITEELIETISDAVANSINNSGQDVIGDFEVDIDQSYGGNSFEVTISDIDFNETRIAEIVAEVLSEELETEEETEED